MTIEEGELEEKAVQPSTFMTLLSEANPRLFVKILKNLGVEIHLVNIVDSFVYLYSFY